MTETIKNWLTQLYEREIKDPEELSKKLVELIYDFLEELMRLVIEYLQEEY